MRSEQEIAGLKGEVATGQEALSELQAALDTTENLNQQRRRKRPAAMVKTAC